MPAPDLTFARRRVTELMTDECVIWRDAGPSDDTLDYTTGEIERPDPVEVYRGMCMVTSEPAAAGVQDYVGAAPVTVQQPKVRVPFDAPDVQVGDVVEVLVSQDVTLDGDRYSVRDVAAGTYRVWRELVCARWVEGEAGDWLT